MWRATLPTTSPKQDDHSQPEHDATGASASQVVSASGSWELVDDAGGLSASHVLGPPAPPNPVSPEQHCARLLVNGIHRVMLKHVLVALVARVHEPEPWPQGH